MSAMNPNEPYSNVQNTSEGFRSVPQSSEDFGDLHNTSKRAGGVGRGKKYAGAEIPDHDIGHDFLIMEEVYAEFEAQGERRSLRMIGEYCKTGELICSYDTDDKRWHITRESVEQKIAKIKALNARRTAAAPQNPRITSEAFSERPVAPQRATEEAPPQSEAIPPSPEADKKIAHLEQEVLDLKITNRAKDMYIAQLVETNEKLLTRVETTSTLVGRLKEQLLRLVAPQESRDIDALPASPDTTPDPSAATESPSEPLADNINPAYAYAPQ
jgi:hypothetical protein